MAFCISSTSLSFGAVFRHPNLNIPKRTITRISVHKQVQCIANSELTASTVVRRSGNYQPSIWDEDHIQSLTSDYTGEAYIKQAEKLKEEVRMMLNKVSKPLDQLELIDTLQRLGIAYHFDSEIKNLLDGVLNDSDDKWKKENLYAASLEFRLLRQHGYSISQEGFNSFKDKMGNFKPCLCEDIKVMLSLYEASYYGIEGESIMEEAWEFSSNHLKDLDNDIDPNLAVQVKRALDLPLHWWPPRVATRWFIDMYERREDMNHLLLQLAKLDFNIVQGMHLEDLKDLLRWWKNTGLGEKLTFARNSLVISFLWAVGIAFEPQYSNCRKIIAKAIALITVIDDIYDVYGTLPEIELFTDVIERWDIKAMEKLPNYMKISFLALYNHVNEMAYDILKEQDSDVSMTLRKTWTSSFQASLQEARWYHTQYKPTLEEYLKNAHVSITGPTIAILSYLSSTNPVMEKELQFLESKPDIVYWSSIVFRLQDDLGTSSDEIKRGDVPKAIQCYMNDTGCSEEAAREHIKDLMRQLWKKVNLHTAAADCPLSQTITQMIVNLTRTSHCVYQHGDGHGNQGQEIKDVILSMFFQPIPL